MKRIDKAMELREAHKFEMRSCWECNTAHDWMKECGGLRWCFDCGRWTFQGGYLNDDTHAESEYDPTFPPAKVVCLTMQKRRMLNDER